MLVFRPKILNEERDLIEDHGTPALLGMVLCNWFLAWKRSPAFCIRFGREDFPQSFRSAVSSQDKCTVGPFKFHSCNHNLGRIDRIEPVQQLCSDCLADRILVDDAYVWDRDQRLPE